MNAGEVRCVFPGLPRFVCIQCEKEHEGNKNYYLCDSCYDQWQNEPIEAPSMKAMIHFPSCKASPGHIKDIKSRRMAEDGRHVEREKPKRSYSFGN